MIAYVKRMVLVNFVFSLCFSRFDDQGNRFACHEIESCRALHHLAPVARILNRRKPVRNSSQPVSSRRNICGTGSGIVSHTSTTPPQLPSTLLRSLLRHPFRRPFDFPSTPFRHRFDPPSAPRGPWNHTECPWNHTECY